MNMQTVTFDADLFKLVPLEPTDEMLNASINSISPWNIIDAYKSMLAVSPPINTKVE